MLGGYEHIPTELYASVGRDLSGVDLARLQELSRRHRAEHGRQVHEDRSMEIARGMPTDHLWAVPNFDPAEGREADPTFDGLFYANNTASTI